MGVSASQSPPRQKRGDVFYQVLLGSILQLGGGSLTSRLVCVGEKERENLSPRPKRKKEKKEEKKEENYKEKEKIERKGLPGDKEARRIWLNWGLDMT